MSYLQYPRVRGLTWEITRTPQWETLTQRMSSGREFRLKYWQYPLWKWELTYNYLKDNPLDPPPGYANPDTDLSILQGFFNQMAGQYNVFLFDDVNAGSTPLEGPWDSVVQVQFGSGDGTTTSFPLLRPSGGFADWIQQPVLNPPTMPLVYKAGTLLTYGTDYSIDPFGNVAFAVAPASGNALKWTGAYMWPVRFGDDSMDLDTMMFQLWALKKITLQQVRL